MSNTISGNAGAAGATIALSGAATASTTSASDGTYSFSGLSAGAYVVTPTLTGAQFTPTSLNEIIVASDITDANFVAQAAGVFYTQTATYDFTSKPDANPLPSPWEASGQGGDGLQNASGFAEGTDATFANVCEEHWDGVVFPDDQYGEITIHSLNNSAAFVGLRHGDTFTSGYLLLDGDEGDGTQAVLIYIIESDGTYTLLAGPAIVSEAPGDVLRFEAVGSLLTGFVNGVPVVSATDSNYTSGQVAVDAAPVAAFTDVQISSFRAGNVAPLHSISGSVGVSGAGATITLSGAASATTTADGSGNYSFSGLAPGTYQVTPGLAGHMFSPSDATVVLTTANVTGVDFLLFTPRLSFPIVVTDFGSVIL